jgi:predicted RNA-binding protein with RPS1 domain
LFKNGKAVSGGGGSSCDCPRCGFAAGLCRCFFLTTTGGSTIISPTKLFSSVDAESATASDAANEEAEDAAVPADVEAMDGIESNAEAHNASRPARQSIAKRPGGGGIRPPSKPLAEFTVGEVYTGVVKTLTSYGAFIDIGAETEGLLHISNLSAAFVSDVAEVLQQGQEYQVRILEINPEKKQLALTMLTIDEETQQLENKSSGGGGGGNRRAAGGGGAGGGGPTSSTSINANSEIFDQLDEIEIDMDEFVTGTVVNIVDFGAFVRIDCRQFDESITGEIDGLVHISQLQAGGDRVTAVTDVVVEGMEVQVRLLSIDGEKVGLSMISLAAEQAQMDEEDQKNNERNKWNDDDDGEDKFMGNKDWKKDYESFLEEQPKFTNNPVIWDKTSRYQ